MENAERNTKHEIRSEYCPCLRDFALSCLFLLCIINPTHSKEPERMLIVSPSIFMNTLHPLIEWRIQHGIEIDILNMDSVGQTPAELKAAIAGHYAQLPFTYLLLVGDDMHIPAYIVRKSDKYYIMDNWYAELSGNEGYPDVAMGRFSAETAEQVARQVEKTIAYETYPPEAEYFSIFAGIASESGPGDQNEYDFEHIRNIGKRLLAYTYTSGYEFFEGTHGELDLPGDPHAGMISSAINDGVGIIFYCGHGESDRFVTGNFQSSHIDSLTNYNKLPVVISTACFNGNYAERTCMAEHWLRASHEGKATGAVAALMCSGNVEWNEPMTGQDEITDILTNPSINPQEKTLGKMVLQSLHKITDTYGNPETSQSWLLFGDPALTVRTAKPNDINIIQPIIKEIQCYPNPTNGQLYIHFSELPNEQTEVVLCSISGNCVATFSLSGMENSIDLAHLPQGVYIATIIHQNNIISTKKIIKR